MTRFDDRSKWSYDMTRIWLCIGWSILIRYLVWGWWSGRFALSCLRCTICTATDYRWTACISLIVLCVIVIYLLMGNEMRANDRAVLLYYLLCVTTIWARYQDSRLDQQIQKLLTTSDQVVRIRFRTLSIYVADLDHKPYTTYPIRSSQNHIWSWLFRIWLVIYQWWRYCKPVIVRLSTHLLSYRYRYLGMIIWLPWIVDTWYLMSLDRTPMIVRSRSQIQLTWPLFPTLTWIWNSIWLPSWMINNLFWILPFPIIWYYGHRIAQSYPRYVQVFVVLLALCNPFVYARMADGQLNVVRMYVGALMRWVHLTQITNTHSLSTLQLKDHIILLWLSLLIPMFSIHSIYGIILMAIVIILMSRRSYRDMIISILGVLWLIWLCNVYWIIPTLAGSNDAGAVINQMDNIHRQAFSTQAGTTNLYRNTLSMRWYWWEAQHRFLPHYLFFSNYHMLMLIWLILLIYGIREIYRQSPYHACVMSSAIVAIWISSHGDQWIFGSMSDILYRSIPGYTGLREPHKRIAFLLVFYLFVMSKWLWWLDDLLSRQGTKYLVSRAVMYILMISPLLYTPAMLMWLRWQIKPIHYPQSRFQVQKLLHQTQSSQSFQSCSYQDQYPDQPCYRTLVLPWHGYITISRIGKRVPTSVTMNLGSDLLIADTVEFGWIYTQTSRPASQIIQQYINNQSGFMFHGSQWSTQFVQDLKSMGISHILLLKEADWKLYQSGLHQIKPYISQQLDLDSIRLYQLNP